VAPFFEAFFYSPFFPSEFSEKFIIFVIRRQAPVRFDLFSFKLMRPLQYRFKMPPGPLLISLASLLYLCLDIFPPVRRVFRPLNCCSCRVFADPDFFLSKLEPSPFFFCGVRRSCVFIVEASTTRGFKLGDPITFVRCPKCCLPMDTTSKIFFQHDSVFASLFPPPPRYQSLSLEALSNHFPVQAQQASNAYPPPL